MQPEIVAVMVFFLTVTFKAFYDEFIRRDDE